MIETRSPDTFSGLAIVLPQGTSVADVVAYARLETAGRFGQSDWHGYYFQASARNLVAEIDPRGYRLMLLPVRTEPRILVVALGPISQVAEAFFDRLAREYLVRRAVFRVDRIVALAARNELAAPSDDTVGFGDKGSTNQSYRLSYVQGRVSLYGDTLTSLSLYGKDVTRAQLFTEIARQVSWYYCGIRSARGAEIVKVGGDGGVICAGISKTGKRRVERLERVADALETFRALGLIRI